MQGERQTWIRPWVDDDRVTYLPDDDRRTGTAERQVVHEDLAHLRSTPAQRHVVVGLLETAPQNVLVKERDEILQVAGVEGCSQSVAWHGADYGVRLAVAEGLPSAAVELADGLFLILRLTEALGVGVAYGVGEAPPATSRITFSPSDTPWVTWT
jgi:hypothetical protein